MELWNYIFKQYIDTSRKGAFTSGKKEERLNGMRTYCVGTAF